jgi:DNA-binding Xre family transcriptional regulator
MAKKIRRVSYEWHLRRLMAERGMFATTDLAPHLAERGVNLSSVQVYRLVAQRPERLNLHVLAALCDILEVAPGDLVEPVVEAAGAAKKTAVGGTAAKTAGVKGRRPKRARIVKDSQ